MISVCYGFFYLAVLLLWAPIANIHKKQMVWGSVLIIAIILALITHQIDLIALLPIGLLFSALYYRPKYISDVIIFIVGFGMVVVHKIPGFHNLKILNHIYFSPDAIPYSLYLNIDKVITGILIIGLTLPVIINKRDWWSLCKQLVSKIIIILPIILILALVLGFVRLDPKWPNSVYVWAVTNLLFACVAEEAFFRGFIQKRLGEFFTKFKYGNYTAILLASIIFGLSHFPGGIKYVVLATVAGIGYGWVYFSTKRIEGSIIIHFLVNFLQFLLFTYPALATAFLH